MNRKDFIRKSLITAAVGAIAPAAVANKEKLEATKKEVEQVGYNHLPNKEDRKMNTVYHQADTRGHANHGWLDSHHTFSFANYHNPARMHFGVLRVLNDDVVAAGKGFGRHPHDNMEIISIPMYGDLEHEDSMGNKKVIAEGDVQVMSAGTGVYHSEYNKNKDKDVKFLQIWMFPKERNVTPRYDQISLKDIEKKNEFYQVLSPNKEDDGVWVHQDAWFHMAEFDQDKSLEYKIRKAGNGAYIFVLEGELVAEDRTLSKRDGFGVWDTEAFQLKAKKGSKALIMDIPMNI